MIKLIATCVALTATTSSFALANDLPVAPATTKAITLIGQQSAPTPVPKEILPAKTTASHDFLPVATTKYLGNDLKQETQKAAIEEGTKAKSAIAQKTSPSVTSTPEPVIAIATNPIAPEIAAAQTADQDLAFDQQRDQEIFDQIQAQIGAFPKTKNFLKKRDNAAIVAFYKERNYQTAWFDNGEPTPLAKKLVETLQTANEDGLNPTDYETNILTISRKNGSKADAIAKADLDLSLALTRYTREAYAGRVDPRHFSKKEITIKPHYPDSIDALNRLVSTQEPAKTLRSYNPQHKGYLALRAEYNRLRTAKKQDATPPIPAGKSLKVGMRDARVPLVYQKLGIAVPEENAILYSKDLSNKVKAYQANNGLIADGVAGKATLAMLNDDRKDLLANLIANMERWRWLPRELGAFHVFVNIPTFHVQIISEDKKIHETRVVVGKRANKTPVFSDQMEYLVVNPYWNVPRSIASKELLPQIKTDPSAFFSKKNYQVLASVNGRTTVLDPTQLDWSKVDAKQVRLRQPPGTRNALGRIKFMFPNRHAVYLHDTPSRSLFNRDYRAFSHGCVRVHKPLEFADVILSQTDAWNASRVKKIIGGKERRVNLDNKIPVHLAYFTTWMSESGTLQLRSDIYGHNAKVKKLLGL